MTRAGPISLGHYPLQLGLAGSAQIIRDGTIFPMPIVLDYHVPEDQGSLAWARHNQLLVCTPKVLHLLVPEAAPCSPY